MRNIGTAMFSWLTDQVGAASAGGTVNLASYTGRRRTPRPWCALQLVSQYMQDVPTIDGWKGTYFYRLDVTNPLDAQVMAVGSGGRDKSTPTVTYTVGAFDPTDYNQDIVWADGYFARWPQKITRLARFWERSARVRALLSALVLAQKLTHRRQCPPTIIRHGRAQRLSKSFLE